MADLEKSASPFVLNECESMDIPFSAHYCNIFWILRLGEIELTHHMK